MVIEPTSHHFLAATQRMAKLLGLQIRLARLTRGWSEAALAERAHIARATLQKIERGHPTVALGLVLEACAVLGLSVSGRPGAETQDLIERTGLELAALPRRIRTRKVAPDDAFCVGA